MTPPTANGSCSRPHLLAGLQQPVHGPERVVHRRVEEEAHGVLGVADPGGGRQLDRLLDLLERAVEAVENAVELHGHLERERPAGRCRRADRRAAGIGEIVGVVLRLEHVEHVGAERLGSTSRRRSRPGTSCRRRRSRPSPGGPVTPVPSSVLTNFVAVRKSGWFAGMM